MPRAPRVLLFTTVFPNAAQPVHGVFVRERMAGLPADCEVRVVAPVPWFPFARNLRPGLRPEVAARERTGSVPVDHPRFFSCPGILKCLDGLFLFLSTVAMVTRLRREFRFDVIDAHFAYPDGLAAVLLGRVLRVPVCITLRGTLPLVARFRLRRPQAVFALKRAERVIAVSSSLRRSAMDLGIPGERVRVIRNGVDPALFPLLDRGECRRRLGLAEEGPWLLSVGTLSPRKGFDILLEATAGLGAAWPDIRVAVVGGAGAEGFVLDPLRRRAAELGLAERVTFAGQQPRQELAAWYGAADAFVLASAHEGCPNVVLEALACGTPVVATDVGDIREILDEGRTGVVVPRRDAAAVAAGIASVLGRSWDRAELRQSATSRPWSAVGREVAEELRAAVSSEARRQGLRLVTPAAGSAPPSPPGGAAEGSE